MIARRETDLKVQLRNEDKTAQTIMNQMSRELHGAFDSAGDRAKNLAADKGHMQIIETIANALEEDYGQERARDIAFHMSDWIADAAFLVALHLYPERFSPKEIDDGMMDFFVHATAHAMAATHIANQPLNDTFGLGLEIDP